MAELTHVPVGVFPHERFAGVLALEQYRRFEHAVKQARETFEGRVVWNVNSTAKGGGVAEMLRSLLAYARGAGIDAQWVVISAQPDFFDVTKRIHNHLHGSIGSGPELGDKEREIYESALAENAEELSARVRPEDVVLLHDPQTAGLIPKLKDITGATVIWRCHIGLDLPNDIARGAWSFLLPYMDAADAFVFSREAFRWEGLESARVEIVPPSIDAFSPKNQQMDPDTVEAIVVRTQLVRDHTNGNPTFVRADGSPGRVDRPIESYDDASPAPADVPLVVQVSRWDRLKDPLGVIEGFAEHIAPHGEAHLIVAGPAVQAVADDPEGMEVLKEARAAWDALPKGIAQRVHLACLPMFDGEENAAIVNALQRRADVIVQKSLAEGFGLTVAEGMWKARPVVASRIGGIQDQIEHGFSGLLVDDARDLKAYGDAVVSLLQDPESAKQIGRNAQQTVRDRFLGPRHLVQYLDLIGSLIE
jgi:trehalose synthase